MLKDAALKALKSIGLVRAALCNRILVAGKFIDNYRIKEVKQLYS